MPQDSGDVAADAPAEAADLRVLGFLWGKVGLFAFLVGLAALFGMMSQDQPFDALKLPQMGSYTLTLFSTPLLAAMVLALAWIGLRHARAAVIAGAPAVPVPWDIPGLERSRYRAHVAALSLAVCLGLPALACVWSYSKFLHGTYAWEPEAGGDCRSERPTPAGCVPQGTTLQNPWPERGLGNPLRTRYRYAGGKDFVPVVQPLLYGLLVLAALVQGGRFATAALRGGNAARSVGRSL